MNTTTIDETDEIQAEDTQPTNESADLNFNNQMEAIPILERLRGLERAATYKRNNGPEVVSLSARIAAVVARIKELSEGLPRISDPKSLRLQSLSATDRSQDRHIELGACITIKQNQSHKRFVYASRPGTDAVIGAVVNAPSFQECAARLTGAIVEHQIELLPHFAFLYPSSRQAEIKTAIQNPNIDAAERLSLCREAQELSGQHAIAMCAAVTSNMNDSYRKTVAPLESEVKTVALSELKKRKSAAVESEKAFFQSHGVEWKPTAVSLKFDAAIKRVEAALNPPARHPAPSLAMPQVIDPRNTALEYLFGIPYDPIALAATQ